MPKNMFQRPIPVTRTNKVPRHGAPPPVKQIGSRKTAPATELPSLATLLKGSKPS